MCAEYCLDNIIIMSPSFMHTDFEEELDILKQFAVYQIQKCVSMVDPEIVIKR